MIDSTDCARVVIAILRMRISSLAASAPRWVVVLLLAVAGCKKDGEATIAPDPANASPARPDAVADFEIADASVLRGCRAPSEPGCARCCEPETTKGGCLIRTAETDWYNGTRFSPDPCPAACSPCAACSLRTEKALRAQRPRPECDCTKPTGIDPCIDPGSCECYCQRRTMWLRACPMALR
jgi:hypothetical protein